jgi:hypothetical protein
LLLLLPFLRAFGFYGWIFDLLEKHAFIVIAAVVLLQHLHIGVNNLLADAQILLCLSFLWLLFYGRGFQGRGVLLFLNGLSLLLVSRIFFRITLSSYFFYVGIVPLLFLSLFASRVLQLFAPRNRKVLLAYVGIFLAILLIRVSISTVRLTLSSPVTVKTEIGTVRNSSFRTTWALKEAIRYLGSLRLKPETLLVLPEGSVVNFFLGIRHPLYHPTTLPHVLRAYGEEEILGQISADSPEVIMFVHRYSPLFGQEELFLVDYGEKIAQWVFENYSLVAQFGRVPFSVRVYSDAGVFIFVRDDLVKVDLEFWLKSGQIQYRPFRRVLGKKEFYERLSCQ